MDKMQITGETTITGVFGWPVKHSLSPVFQNAAFLHSGLNWVYIPFEVNPENLGKAVDAIRVFSIKGINITIPHKKNVPQYMDSVDDDVNLLGVANTIVNENGVLKGYTTDGIGFLRSLKEDGGFDPAGKNVFMFGSGGSAFALSGSLVRAGISNLIICNRTYEKAVMLKNHLKKHFGFENIEIVQFEKRNHPSLWKNVDLVINTTSIGMNEDNIILVQEKNLSENIFVYDIVYNRKTNLIETSLKRGIRCLDGLSMLIFQGAVSFTLWTGIDAPVEIMKKAIGDYRKNGKK
ncbi:MAG TPA: shikimate dehydrogenase [bacterium]|nr:shikimate dehydrogenase [bacterium]